MDESNSETVIRLLSELPGIGPKTAERLAFFLMEEKNRGVALSLASCIKTVAENITFCTKCFNFAEDDLCPICSNDDRNKGVVCVVDTPKDLVAIEKTGGFQGTYHVLQNNLFSTNDNTLDFLLAKFDTTDILEVVIALNTTHSGQLLGEKISKAAEERNIKVTRISVGIPIGSNLEFISPETLAQALNFRQKFQ